MRGDDGFHVEGADPVARHDDHVVVSRRKSEVALIVIQSQVSGQVPTSAGRQSVDVLFWSACISLEPSQGTVGQARCEQSGLVRPKFFMRRGIDHGHVPARQGAAHGSRLDGLPQIRVMVVVEQHARFSLAKMVMHHGSQGGRRPSIDVRRQRFARAGGAAQRHESVGYSMGFQATVDGWGRGEVGHPLALEDRQRAFRGELLGVHD
ncbi:hypothetical protein D3C87_1285510 [compost metagenome]